MKITASKVKKIVATMVSFMFVCLGLILLYQAFRWAMLLYNINELTGSLGNFAMIRIAGMFLTFAAITEYHKSGSKMDILFVIIGILFWLVSSVIFCCFLFTDQKINFIIMYFLISIGLVVIHVPKLISF